MVDGNMMPVTEGVTISVLEDFVNTSQDIIKCIGKMRQNMKNDEQTLWTLQRLDFVEHEMIELLNQAEEGKFIFMYRGKYRMLKSTYLMTDMARLSDTSLGSKINKLQNLCEKL